MSLYGVLPLVILLLQQHGRVSYRGLKVQFDLDDVVLEALKEELFFRRVAVDEAGRGLVWSGDVSTAMAPACTSPDVPSSASQHLSAEVWQPSAWGAEQELLAALLRVMHEAGGPDSDVVDVQIRGVNRQTRLFTHLSAALRVLQQGAERQEAVAADLAQDVLPSLSAESGCDPHERRVRTDAWYLPDEPLLGFVEIPAGPFLMGSDPASDADTSPSEQPQHRVVLSRYYMARYPVTVAQFQTFVEASGYHPTCTDSLHGQANHPVVWVNWHDALAYCDWLTKRLRTWPPLPAPLAEVLRYDGGCVALPSEAEWEKAARGTDGLCYPWGHTPDPERANYSASGFNTTSPVGFFPRGASPYGIEDAAGNVWE